MKKKRFWLGAAVGIPLLLLSTLAWAEYKGQFGLFIGQKSMDLDVSGDADGVEDQQEFGFSFSFGDVEWPVMFAVDVLFSEGDDDFLADSYSFVYVGPYFDYTVTYDYTADYTFETMEIDIGVRKFWREDKKFVPYVGGGLALITLEGNVKVRTSVDFEGTPVPESGSSVDLIDDEDTALGYWVNGGVLWRFNSSWEVGADFRYSDAEAKLNTGQGFFNLTGVIDQIDTDAGGFHAGIYAGYHW